MVSDGMGRLLAAWIASPPAFVHPLILDVLLGAVYGVAIGLALSSVRSATR